MPENDQPKEKRHAAIQQRPPPLWEADYHGRQDAEDPHHHEGNGDVDGDKDQREQRPFLNDEAGSQVQDADQCVDEEPAPLPVQNAPTSVATPATRSTIDKISIAKWEVMIGKTSASVPQASSRDPSSKNHHQCERTWWSSCRMIRSTAVGTST